jgi:hypothetical protein
MSSKKKRKVSSSQVKLSTASATQMQDEENPNPEWAKTRTEDLLFPLYRAKPNSKKAVYVSSLHKPVLVHPPLFRINAATKAHEIVPNGKCVHTNITFIICLTVSRN